jgi:hypothetical protein
LDRGRPLAAFLRALGLILFACSGARASAPLPVREANWLAPAQRLHMLTTRPEECVPEDTPDIVSLVYGTVAFRDPMLLGGQAARAGLSCMSCHRGGRNNPAFQFPGLSGAPGTADVTSSLMSSHRGDGVANPKPIPDLTFAMPKVSRVDERGLEAFIRGLIVEEFDGEPPSPVVLKGLASYVRALDPKNCPSRQDQPYGLANALADYFVALGAAETALVDRDPDTAIAMLRGARSILGGIDARYQGPGLEAPRAALEEAGVALAQVQRHLQGGGDPAEAADIVHKRWAATRRWAEPLIRTERQSLYNPKLLKAALAR